MSQGKLKQRQLQQRSCTVQHPQAALMQSAAHLCCPAGLQAASQQQCYAYNRHAAAAGHSCAQLCVAGGRNTCSACSLEAEPSSLAAPPPPQAPHLPRLPAWVECAAGWAAGRAAQQAGRRRSRRRAAGQVPQLVPLARQLSERRPVCAEPHACSAGLGRSGGCPQRTAAGGRSRTAEQGKKGGGEEGVGRGQ